MLPCINAAPRHARRQGDGSGSFAKLTSPSDDSLELLVILTKVPPRLRRARADDIFRMGGPASVRASLIRGLREIGLEIAVDPVRRDVTGDVGVLAGEATARWATQSRMRGRFRRLVIGPNVVVLPSDTPEIDWKSCDAIVVPSKWVADLWSTDMPHIADKVVVWAAGVDDKYWSPVLAVEDRPIDVLVYVKTIDNDIVDAISLLLAAAELSVITIKYGEYTPAQYREALRASKTMVFLSRSESQGIALFEAWSCGVPTLVWDRGYWSFRGRVWDGASSAPYLAPDAGLAFGGRDDLAKQFDVFWNRHSSFCPRNVVLARFTLTKAAHAYRNLFASQSEGDRSTRSRSRH